MAPSLVPLPRHPGGCRLLLASLAGSERRGNFIHGARPRAVAPSSRRMSSPARIPDWEREEGKLCPWRPASCRRPVIPADVMTCSFHQAILVPWALLLDSRPGVVSSNSVSVSLDLIFVKDPGSSPSSCWTSPSSGPDSPRSLPASSDSVGVMSLSGVVPLVWGRRMVDGGPGGCPSPGPWYRPYRFRRVRTRW